ncbi:MAG: hypothetical protein GQ564_06535 [Bacteroidales bacterium]|nr:hypothetical protein [Bacteroidales bacterium]
MKKFFLWLKKIFLKIFGRSRIKLNTVIIWRKYGPVVKISYDFNGNNRKEPLLLWIHESGDFKKFINLAFIEGESGEHEIDIVFDDFPEGKNCEVTFSTLDLERAKNAPVNIFSVPEIPLALN